ncbi:MULTISPECIES: ABC transporter permease [Streptomyces]|uniref:ABC transporter permease n=1 Tax=Streptomyces evansiae TaxID=3075535 RepID=A0ABU2QSV0_9ACTN|nr:MULTISPECIES: ABC transporter permease [unclassified Streptomyces]MDT0407511.1 ABC transporter permease [Streptomyces sp. DSM 41979]MDT0420520.1 ABC transporter permease [Streptomyces sp. DSM 41859]WEH29199.1 ABC transporter permease [Streptomyces sp. AM 3-1-1]
MADAERAGAEAGAGRGDAESAAVGAGAGRGDGERAGAEAGRGRAEPAAAEVGAGRGDVKRAEPAGAPRTRAFRLPGSGLLASELRTTFRRGRTLALLGVLAAIPVLIGIAVRIETGGGGGADAHGGGGPAFASQITNNGLFLVFTALAATLPVFLPMAVGVVAGDAVAGEASAGTLRYLLVAPAGRTRLLLTKYGAVAVFCAAATGVVTLAALLTGLALFPVGDLTTISGTRIGFGEGVGRALLIALVVAASLLGVAALGLFVSTLTNSGIAAMATTVGLVITVQILDVIPQLSALQPYFFSHHWLAFADLVRDPLLWDDVVKNLGLQAVYVALFGSLAWARLGTKDITT